MLEYVPTAPDSLHTATVSVAVRRRRRSRSSCSAHSATLAPNVVGSAWMPWVRPIITVAVLAGHRRDGGDEPVGGVDEQLAGVAHRPAQRRVDDVGRRQSVVDPRSRRRTDRLLHDVDERRHVVVGGSLALGHGGDERLVDRRRLRPAGGGVVCGDDPELPPALRWRAARPPASAAAAPRPTTARPSPAGSSGGSSAAAHCQIR